MRSFTILFIIAILAASFAGCGTSGPAPVQAPVVAGSYTAQTAHATTDATIADAGGGSYYVVFQPTGISTSPITATMPAGVLSVSDDGNHQLFLFTDSDGSLWLDVDHVRYALHVSA